MTDFLLNIFIIVVALIVHETGHFLAGNIFNYAIYKYSIGIGPKLIQKKKKDILYTLRLLPIGAYVSFENNSKNKRSLSKPDARNLIVLSMGVIFNLILAISSLILMYLLRGNNISESLITSIYNFTETLKPFLFNIESFINNGLIINISENLIWACTDIDLILISVFWINLNMVFLNLLPIPFLDGGMIIISGIEIIIKREIPGIIMYGIYLLFIIAVGTFLFPK